MLLLFMNYTSPLISREPVVQMSQPNRKQISLNLYQQNTCGAQHFSLSLPFCSGLKLVVLITQPCLGIFLLMNNEDCNVHIVQKSLSLEVHTACSAFYSVLWIHFLILQSSSSQLPFCTSLNSPQVQAKSFPAALSVASDFVQCEERFFVLQLTCQVCALLNLLLKFISRISLNVQENSGLCVLPVKSVGVYAILYLFFMLGGFRPSRGYL